MLRKVAKRFLDLNIQYVTKTFNYAVKTGVVTVPLGTFIGGAKAICDNDQVMYGMWEGYMYGATPLVVPFIPTITYMYGSGYLCRYMKKKIK